MADKQSKLLVESWKRFQEEQTKPVEEGLLEKVIGVGAIGIALYFMGQHMKSTDETMRIQTQLSEKKFDREGVNADFKEAYGEYLVGDTSGFASGKFRKSILDGAIAAAVQEGKIQMVNGLPVVVKK
jgi:hypothetical protein